ncbi:Uncharacterised protein [Salmonella enterica subsp. arizonae]|nr:Uncharacterised protein [Salmonella enterica subsp. arizonae]
MKAMQSRCQASSGKPISPLILALQDPVGITHELAHWATLWRWRISATWTS